MEPGRAANLVVINSLRAAGDVQFPVILGIISMWGISVPLAYILGVNVGWGLIGVWVAMISDEWFRGLGMIWRWKQGKWRNMAFTKRNTIQEAQGYE